MAAPYLAIQTSMTVLALSDPVNATGYRVRDLAFPAPSKTSAAERAMRWGTKVSGNWDELAERVIELDVVGATEAVAENNLLVLQRAVDSHRAQLVWRSDTASQTIWTTIRTAQVTESRVDALRRAQGKIRVTISLVTDSTWFGDGVPFSGTSASHIIVDVTKGDRPAPFRIKATASSANSLLGLGIKPNPAAAYDPVDTVASPAAVTLASAYADLHTAEVKDTNAHKGQHVAVARVATNAATAANTRYRAVASVTGSGVAASAAATKDSRAAQATAARLTVLPGLVDIPAGGVPGIEAGSGYATPVVTNINTTAPSTTTQSLWRRFTVAARSIHTGAVVRVLNGPAASHVWISLRNSAGAVITAASAAVPGNHDGEITVTWGFSPELTPGDYEIHGAPGSGVSLYYGGASVTGGAFHGGVPYVGILTEGATSNIIAQDSAGSVYTGLGEFWQTFTLASRTRITGIAVNCRTPDGGDLVARITSTSGVSLSGWVELMHAGPRQMISRTLSTPIELSAGEYRLLLTSSYHLNEIGHSTANPYAGGRSSVDAAHDIGFRVVGRAASPCDMYLRISTALPLGFDSTVTVQGNCSESARTATLTSLTLLPADDFAVVVERAFSANEGILIEATDPLTPPAVYLTTSADGTAGPALAPTAWHGAPRLPVASNRIVSAGEGMLTVSGVYYPCYSNAAAGSL